MQQEPKFTTYIRQQSSAPHVQPAVEHGLRHTDAKTAKVSCQYIIEYKNKTLT